MMGYPLLMVEYERGWGSKPDGYLVFESDAKRIEYLDRETSGRDYGPVPDYYVAYEVKAPVALTKPHVFDKEGKFYTDKLTATYSVV